MLHNKIFIHKHFYFNNIFTQRQNVMVIMEIDFELYVFI